LKNVVKRNIISMISTNGLLLNQYKVQELFKREFKISISLDGPKDQHDLFRIRVDKKGSFEDILENITYIRNIYPEKYASNIRYLLTIHPYHNIKRIEEFFLSMDSLFNEKNVNIVMVDLDKIDIHYKKKWYKSNLKQFEQINNELDKDKWFYKKVQFNWLERLINNPTLNLIAVKNFTGNCFPGVANMFIEVNGSIHVCEKINHYFPIGNVLTGLDINAIAQIVKNWNEYIQKRRCWDCDVWWLCNFCFASQADAEYIRIEEKECLHFSKSIQRSIKRFLSLKEKEDEIENPNPYSTINNYIESL